LQLKRRPLSEALAALGEKGGVAISLSPEMRAEGALLTMGVAEMPVHEVMTALTRLYGLDWTKNAGGAYRGARTTRTALEAQLLQGRKLSSALLRGETAARHAREAQEAGEFLNKVTLALGQEALKRPEGVALSDLPQDLQSGLRLRVQEALAPTLTDAQSRLQEKLDALNGPWRVELEVPQEKVRRVTLAGGRQVDVPTPARVHVLTGSNQILTTFALSDPRQEAPRTLAF
jgi:hypothetical protein